MGTRLELHEVLCDTLESRHVYYQPPENVKMEYPAIVYSRDDIRSLYANNQIYGKQHAYEVIVIDYDPDSEIVERVVSLPSSRFLRHYVSDNLNHDVFLLYY